MVTGIIHHMAVLNGIDVLERQGLSLIEGSRVGVLTNHTGLTVDLRSTIDILRNMPKVRLTAIFTPEHGLQGKLDEKVPDLVDERTGIPIYSLYGNRKKPTKEQLSNVGVLLYDIQDIGTRYYTYISTMRLAMEACAEANIPFVVLDRVNPINGVEVEGNLPDPDRLSFTAPHTIPIRHSMTVGELAKMFNEERKIGADLTVVSCEGWKRAQWLDETGLYWVNPSPNMRRLQQALLYPGIGLLESTNISVGRGTDTPFELFGAPWIHGWRLADALNEQNLPGVRFVPLQFTPTYSTHKDTLCEGVSVFITDRNRLRPFRTGIAIAVTLRRLYPREWNAERFIALLANQEIHRMVLEGADTESIMRRVEQDIKRFRERRKPFLIYG